MSCCYCCDDKIVWGVAGGGSYCKPKWKFPDQQINLEQIDPQQYQGIPEAKPIAPLLTILEYLFGRSSRKRWKKRTACGPGTGTSIQVPGTEYIHEGYLRQPTTNKLEAGPAAKGRDNEGQMRRSHASSVLSRRTTSAAPAQRNN